MKTVCYHNTSFWNRPIVAKPNAATRRDVLNKLVDKLLLAASAAGIVVTLMYFISLC